MNSIPVCDYEGSDYQTSFWEQGDRGYEDACEAVALRRLLPTGGQRMLELGAGAGRNTPRYGAFQEVTLVDFSSTQLAQARQRLGEGPRYRYVAADIYHLPFATGTFDGATMIRTLHHMVEPSQALAQVRQALVPGAVFVLEYANKHNLKAILRYLLGRQAWSPFTHEAVEFAALNFDFHPAAVRAWLQDNNFAIQRQLTVSHYRMSLFKRLVPQRLLVWMDAQAQLTGNWWQLSPSVFVGCRAVAAAGEPAATPPPLAPFAWRCPACAVPLADTPPLLHCDACGRSYPVEDGIYDLRLH